MKLSRSPLMCGAASIASLAFASAAGAADQAAAVTAAAGPTASYNVLRGTTSGGESATPIATGITALTYEDTTGVQGTKYFYTVTATNTAGTSAASNEASATFLVTGAPGTPVGLGAVGN